MNFLSHYYLHRKQNNDYYDVGLTLPDILGLHSKNVRVTEKFLLSIIYYDTDYYDLIQGSLIHIKLDSFFHKSDFFKNNVSLISNSYKEFSSRQSMAFYYSHILLEILIDKVILNLEPKIANDFYKLHKRFNFEKIVPLFSNLKNFNKEKFLDFVNIVANSSFLNDYKENKNIIISLKRVTTRMRLPIEIEISDKIFEQYVNKIFNELFNNITDFIFKLKSININDLG